MSHLWPSQAHESASSIPRTRCAVCGLAAAAYEDYAIRHAPADSHVVVRVRNGERRVWRGFVVRTGPASRDLRAELIALGEAQDAALDGERNNANMNTPSDGDSPRMQLYLSTGKEVRSLAFEPLGPVETDFVNTVAEACSCFGAAGRPATGGAA